MLRRKHRPPAPRPLLEAAQVAAQRERLGRGSHLHHQRLRLRAALTISHQLLLPLPGGGTEGGAVSLRSPPLPPAGRPLPGAAGPPRPRGSARGSRRKVAPAAGWAPAGSQSPALHCMGPPLPKGPPPEERPHLRSPCTAVPTALPPGGAGSWHCRPQPWAVALRRAGGHGGQGGGCGPRGGAGGPRPSAERGANDLIRIQGGARGAEGGPFPEAGLTRRRAAASSARRPVANEAPGRRPRRQVRSRQVNPLRAAGRSHKPRPRRARPLGFQITQSTRDGGSESAAWLPPPRGPA